MAAPAADADATTKAFKPALIIVDLQEDFCPPNGSLAVPSGRDVIPVINQLLTLPFALKVATKDWHPLSHISFAANHPGKQPFADFALITNPLNPSESYSSRLWPVHCVQDTPGAALVPDLDLSRIDQVIEKGTDPRVEMYSAFADDFEQPRGCDSGLAGYLRSQGITDVYVTGLAFDYCVKASALHAAREGFGTVVVRQGTKAVDASVWGEVERELEGKGIKVVDVDGVEVEKIRSR